MKRPDGRWAWVPIIVAAFVLIGETLILSLLQYENEFTPRQLGILPALGAIVYYCIQLAPVIQRIRASFNVAHRSTKFKETAVAGDGGMAASIHRNRAPVTINNTYVGLSREVLSEHGVPPRPRKMDVVIPEGMGQERASVSTAQTDTNSTDAKAPRITEARVINIPSRDGTTLRLVVDAESVSPVAWLEGSFDGPRGNVWGGGSGRPFSEVSRGKWRLVHEDHLTRHAPAGLYHYRNLRVKNEAMFTSPAWEPDLRTDVKPPA